MELTKEQIKRIDLFLEGIGIEYIDIRFEMVDHIATEIESTVENVNAFFEGKGFQVPFIKYMLSRKKEYFESYKKQKRRALWFNIKKTLVAVFKESTKPVNLIIILLFLFAINLLEKFSIKYTSEVIFISFFLSFFYFTIKFNQFRKKFGDVKIIHAYTSILMFNYIISFHFPGITPIFSEGNYSPFLLYKCAITLIVNFLVFKCFLNEKTNIQKRLKKLA
ncbi:hypothetical protein [Tenacibaculum sp.]|uniref:hypothetical protein n=1 Tax=Tenacibaculum sp. TaxID=1906242 RepID=UPI003AA95C20